MSPTRRLRCFGQTREPISPRNWLTPTMLNLLSLLRPRPPSPRELPRIGLPPALVRQQRSPKSSRNYEWPPATGGHFSFSVQELSARLPVSVLGTEGIYVSGSSA